MPDAVFVEAAGRGRWIRWGAPPTGVEAGVKGLVRDWPRSLYYLAYFSAMGVLVPYWPLYLHLRGFGAQAIGQLMALLALARVAAPYAGGFLVDHAGHRVAVVRIAAFLAFSIFVTVPGAHSFAAEAWVMMGFSFFWYATLPSLEASTLRAHGIHYGRVRLWGSIGFIVMVAALGPVLGRYGVGLVVPVLAVLLCGLWLATLAVPRFDGAAHETRRLSLKPGLVVFLLACFLMQVSYGPYYTFYTLYLQRFRYTTFEIGLLWAFAVACEVVLFWQADRLFARFREQTLFTATLALAFGRWILIGMFPGDAGLIIAAQLLHAFTFGLYHAAAVRLAGHYAGPGSRARAQALYGSAAGAGAGIGALWSGYAWSDLGPRDMFLAAAVVAGVAFLLVVMTWFRRGCLTDGPPAAVERL
ncbi:MAG: MFS transporter [Gammaproteobacteria bacterium]|nr:MFS transporter [Gammaproteobacteria bacterium]